MRKFLDGYGVGPPVNALYGALWEYQTLRAGNGWGEDYGNRDGNGWGHGYGLGDQRGNSGDQHNTSFPYELIQFWL